MEGHNDLMQLWSTTHLLVAGVGHQFQSGKKERKDGTMVAWETELTLRTLFGWDFISPGFHYPSSYTSTGNQDCRSLFHGYVSPKG